MKLYIVATIITDTDDETDMFSDIILITKDKRKATRIFNKVNKNQPIRGLDYNNLVAYDDVVMFERDLDKTISNT